MQPGHPRGARDTAEPDQRHPDDVGAHPRQCRDPSVQRRHGEPGDRGRHDQVDVLRGEARGLERVGDGPRTQLDAGLDEGVVGLGEALQLAVAMQGQRQVAVVDSGVGVDPLDHRLVDGAAEQVVGEGVGQLRLAVAVLGEYAGDAQDSHDGDSSGVGVVEGVTVRPITDRASSTGRARQPATAGRDPAPGQPELDQVVEDALVGGGSPESGAEHGAVPAESAGQPDVPEVGVEQGAGRGGVAGSRRPGVAGGECLGGGAPGCQAGGDRVVDALPGHRVDQAGGVSGQQDRARSVPPAAGGQRQAGTLPARAALGGAGEQCVQPGQQVGLGQARRPRPAPGRSARRTRRCRGRRRGRRTRHRPGGGPCRRRSPAPRRATSGSARSRAARPRPARA